MADNEEWDPMGCWLSMSRAHTTSRKRLEDQHAEASQGAGATQPHAKDEEKPHTPQQGTHPTQWSCHNVTTFCSEK